MFKSWVDHIIRHLRQYWEKYAKSYFLILVKMQVSAYGEISFQYYPKDQMSNTNWQRIKAYFYN